MYVRKLGQNYAGKINISITLRPHLKTSFILRNNQCHATVLLSTENIILLPAVFAVSSSLSILHFSGNLNNLIDLGFLMEQINKSLVNGGFD